MIVIPMAGLSRRFVEDGYDVPKYMLEAKGLTLFEHSVKSFQKYFSNEPFLFIALNNGFSPTTFIKEKVRKLGIVNYEIAILEEPTRGQAETVIQGMQQFDLIQENPALTIFNIDTFRPGFSYPTSFNANSVDGYLETFIGSGKNWSNVLPIPNTDQVQFTAEKQEISEFCCTGLYYWRSAQQFADIFSIFASKNVSELQGREFFIAPMYNTLINNGGDVRFTIIPSDEVIFCGVPDEYRQFIAQ